MWDFEHDKELEVLADVTRRGEEIPPTLVRMLEERPPLPPAAFFYVQAYQDLSTCRVDGMGVGRIPWTAIRAYGEAKGLEADVLDGFTDLILAMDRERHRIMCKRIEERAAAAGSQSPPSGQTTSVPVPGRSLPAMQVRR